MPKYPDLCCLQIGFVSTRFAGTDGVSLETQKWAEILENLGHKCFYFAGESDRPAEISYIVEEAFFHNPEIDEINKVIFFERKRPQNTTTKIHQIKDHLKKHLYTFTKKFKLDLLIIENALAIPMNVPLGLAITEFIAETGFQTISHNHDMFWERKRFLVNCVWDYLNMAFPPHMPSIHHVVINSSASNQLSLRTGISSRLIPNVMDFDNPPPPLDEYAQDVRENLNIAKDSKFILQPTRIVQRKGIEHAMELVSRLDQKSQLVISHASGDEGYEYEKFIRTFGDRLNVNTLYVSDKIKDKRDLTKNGEKIYMLSDVYPHADLITYPSDIEGFGNAFLEAIYFRKPIIVNEYSIYAIDIKPKGFRVIEFDGFITEKAIEQTNEVLSNPSLVEEITEHNYKLAKSHYSYTTVERHLEDLLNECFGK